MRRDSTSSQRPASPATSAMADRFALKFHRETREMPVCSLGVAKNGPKLTAHQGGGDRSSGSSASSMIGTKATMAMLASRLERQLGRTVTDRTGLTGEYDYRLTWVPDQAAVRRVHRLLRTDSRRL